jgi:hypothetical protein
MSVDEEMSEQPAVKGVVDSAVGEPNSLDELTQAVQEDLDAEATARRQARNKRKAMRRVEQTKRTKRKASRKARKVTRRQNRS